MGGKGSGVEGGGRSRPPGSPSHLLNFQLAVINRSCSGNHKLSQKPWLPPSLEDLLSGLLRILWFPTEENPKQHRAQCSPRKRKGLLWGWQCCSLDLGACSDISAALHAAGPGFSASDVGCSRTPWPRVLIGRRPGQKKERAPHTLWGSGPQARMSLWSHDMCPWLVTQQN